MLLLLSCIQIFYFAFLGRGKRTEKEACLALIRHSPTQPTTERIGAKERFSFVFAAFVVVGAVVPGFRVAVFVSVVSYGGRGLASALRYPLSRGRMGGRPPPASH